MKAHKYIPNVIGLERRDVPTTIAVLGSGTAPVGILAGHVLPGFSLVDPGQPGNVDTIGTGTAVASVALRQALKFDPNAQILPIVITNAKGHTNTILMTRAIWDAVNSGADVVSISVSSVSTRFDRVIWPYRISPDIPSMRFARSNNVPVVVTAGGTANNNDSTLVWPSNDGSRRLLTNFYSVTSTDDAGNLTSLSNFGRKTVTMGAPGVNVPITTLNGSESTASGSGFASARVAGIIAGIKSTRPDEPVRSIRLDIRAAITRTASTLLRTIFGGSLLTDTLPPQT